MTENHTRNFQQKINDMEEEQRRIMDEHYATEKAWLEERRELTADNTRLRRVLEHARDLLAGRPRKPKEPPTEYQKALRSIILRLDDIISEALLPSA